MNLPVVERIAARGSVKGQIVRFYNLIPAGSGSGAFWIELYNRGDPYEFEYQVVRDFVRASGSIELTVIMISATPGKYQKGLNFTGPALWLESSGTDT